MKRIIAVSVIAVGLGVAAINSQANQQPELKNVMKIKLGHAQKVLEALAKEDFNAIEKNAEALSTLSRTDAWNIHQTPEYMRFSKDFQAVAASMAANAKAKKLEAATLDYVQLTMICVKCHTYTRNAGLALEDSDMEVPTVVSYVE